MFNSVAKYLWGSAEDETDITSDSQQVANSPEGAQGVGEQSHLMPPAIECEECGQVDDWVLVGEADKENLNALPVLQHHHQHYHPHHHHPSHHSSFDSLPQATAAEVELLDEAASLVSQHQNCGDPKSLSDQEDNGLDSGLRPSSPESVFSACSGRSSATYRPRGVDSEEWVVAPPPCFTGSQCGSLSPLVSSPLENLLIEHPSMSVYITHPATNILNSSKTDSCLNLNSQDLSSVNISGSATTLLESTAPVQNGETDTADADTTRAVGSHFGNGTPSRREHGDATRHQHRVTLEKLHRVENSAQSKAISICQKRSVSKQKCKHQNQIREVCSTPKGRINRRNKQMCPSGFRSSRFTQRNNSSSKHV